MALVIKDTVIQTEAIIGVKDNLEVASTATNGAILVGKNIHKGDYKNGTVFDEFGTIGRRDPSSTAAVTPERLANLEDVAVKLYFKGDLFVTNTELERYGTSVSSMNKGIGATIGRNVSRWALDKALIALTGAITSEATLIAGDGSTAVNVGLLNSAVFNLGDMNGDIVSFAAPSLVTHTLLGNAIATTADQISYGAVYNAQVGTLGRKLWTVDNAALGWNDGTNSGSYTLGLVKNAVSIDESEVIKILSDLDITQENSGFRFKVEGAYTVNVKGFAYNTAQGTNPTDSVLADNASWNLIKDIKHGAGVVAKTL